MGDGEDTDRLGAARRAAAELGVVLLLKGPGTVVAAPDGVAYVDALGPSSLATAGSGDVLTGLLGALLAGDAARSGGGWAPAPPPGGGGGGLRCDPARPGGGRGRADGPAGRRRRPGGRAAAAVAAVRADA